jgi:hypothetical protein
MEVVKPLAEPTVQQGGLAGFGFEKWRDSYVAETKLEDADLDKDLFIALPGVEKLDVLIERADDGQTYFAVHDYPELPQSNGSREMPRARGRVLGRLRVPRRDRPQPRNRTAGRVLGQPSAAGPQVAGIHGRPGRVPQRGGRAKAVPVDETQ